jgi:acyl-CoA thioester hydrolase
MIQTTANVRVRYKETDQMGVVYYSNYLVWFEIARTELFREKVFSYRELEEKRDLRLVVAEARCSYIQPARYDDLLNIHCRLNSTGKTSLIFGYTVKRDDELLAEGETVHVFTDPSGKPKRIPADIREALE